MSPTNQFKRSKNHTVGFLTAAPAPPDVHFPIPPRYQFSILVTVAVTTGYKQLKEQFTVAYSSMGYSPSWWEGTVAEEEVVIL